MENELVVISGGGEGQHRSRGMGLPDRLKDALHNMGNIAKTFVINLNGK